MAAAYYSDRRAVLIHNTEGPTLMIAYLNIVTEHPVELTYCANKYAMVYFILAIRSLYTCNLYTGYCTTIADSRSATPTAPVPGIYSTSAVSTSTRTGEPIVRYGKVCS